MAEFVILLLGLGSEVRTYNPDGNRSTFIVGEEVRYMSKECVLLVEDDADIREGVRILLESENYNVTEAENGRQGLELLDEIRIWLFLTYDAWFVRTADLRRNQEVF